MGSGTAELRREFEAIALPFSSALYRAAYRLSRDQGEAEDLVQETYLRGFRTFKNFKAGTNCKAWLFTILWSVVKNRKRTRVRNPEPAAFDPAEEEPEAHADTWGSHHRMLRELDAQTVGAEIVRAFKSISEEARWIVLLVEVEELSYEEVSGILGCPVGTVASRLYRARKQLYVALEKYAQQRGYLTRDARGGSQ